MAKDNVEVEIKIKLIKQKFEKVKKHVSKIAKKIKISHHIDTYYNSSKLNFLKPKYPFEWLTTRQRDGKIKINYKHWYPEGIKNTTHCDEFETVQFIPCLAGVFLNNYEISNKSFSS